MVFKTGFIVFSTFLKFSKELEYTKKVIQTLQ